MAQQLLSWQPEVDNAAGVLAGLAERVQLKGARDHICTGGQRQCYTTQDACAVCNACLARHVLTAISMLTGQRGTRSWWMTQPTFPAPGTPCEGVPYSPSSQSSQFGDTSLLPSDGL